mmetsp:Transcript_96987/g.177727  ORF Transcript_96987/g.177727 Transcript_96987/m.177727 type:complete len:270 (-) Transcript_96987:559-1368(-)
MSIFRDALHFKPNKRASSTITKPRGGSGRASPSSGQTSPDDEPPRPCGEPCSEMRARAALSSPLLESSSVCMPPVTDTPDALLCLVAASPRARLGDARAVSKVATVVAASLMMAAGPESEESPSQSASTCIVASKSATACSSVTFCVSPSVPCNLLNFCKAATAAVPILHSSSLPKLHSTAMTTSRTKLVRGFPTLRVLPMSAMTQLREPCTAEMRTSALRVATASEESGFHHTLSPTVTRIKSKLVPSSSSSNPPSPVPESTGSRAAF